MPAKATTTHQYVLLLASTMTVMAGAGVAPALPSIGEHFAGTPASDVLTRLVLTSPAIAIAVCAPLFGTVIDRYGRRVPYLSAILLYGVGGASGLFLDSLLLILVGRLVLGVAVAGIMTTSTALIADYFSGPRRARVMGLQGAFMAGGGVVFLTVAGVLADVSWRAPFSIYLLAFLIFPLVAWRIHEPAIEHTARIGGSNPFRLMSVRLLYPTAVLIVALFYMIPVQIPFYLKSIATVSNTQIGIALSVATVFSTIMALLFERIRSRLSGPAVLALICALMAGGYLVIWVADSYRMTITGIALAGAGMGMLLPNLSLWLTNDAPERMRGTVLGGMTTAIFLGQFISPLLSQPVADATSLAGSFGVAAMVLAAGAAAWALGASLLDHRADRG